MTSDHTPGDERALARLSPQEYLDLIRDENPELLRLLLGAAVREATQIAVADLWEQPGRANSYWILMMTGINRKEEMQLANELLAWREFSAKRGARVRCIPRSETIEFRCCSTHFRVTSSPTLIFGNTPEMDSFLRLPSPYLNA